MSLLQWAALVTVVSLCVLTAITWLWIRHAARVESVLREPLPLSSPPPPDGRASPPAAPVPTPPLAHRQTKFRSRHRYGG